MPRRSAGQLSLFEDAQTEVPAQTSSTFIDNMAIPVHRWFRYSAGFSATWVKDLVAREKINGRQRVLDPFAGSGTVLLESEACGSDAVGLEAHPFVARVAKTKLLWRSDAQAFEDFAWSILSIAKKNESSPPEYPSLIQKCYSGGALSRLHALRTAWELVEDGSPQSELAWLLLVSILRACSAAGTAQWQYVLPNQAKARVLDPFSAYLEKARLMASDMRDRQRNDLGLVARLFEGDARLCEAVDDGWAELIVTSPPYANNYDYADATRLEMTFMGAISRWRDLQDTVRVGLVRSCTQHVASFADRTEAILADEVLDPIRSEIEPVCRGMEAERENHRGRKTYHTMIASYFGDMARVWRSLRRVTAPGAIVCFVVGDSAPYGVYVPVDRWLGELALAAGFTNFSFEQTRERNVKWKNRKHRVPLKEGRLWIEA